MKTLSTEHRRQLERTVVEARDIAEAGARGALETLAVHHHEPYGHMSRERRTLRNRLRAHARHLGDRVDARSGAHMIDHLVHECAYEHWHGMLFARFLAENHLLIEPEMGVAITLDECEELAKDEGADKWALAARFAHRMLPQVFRPDHPAFEVQFAREHLLKLEGLVECLSSDVFAAEDSLGWVYQFWQVKKKDEVNAAGNKIGANELPSVTQLFTEDYMVDFLLDNSLGAWHAGKFLAANPELAESARSEDELRQAVALPGCAWDYLRFIQGEDGQWTPAAGTFDGWPKTAKELKCLDPCMGSGHFVVAMFERLVALRLAEQKLDEAAAVSAVIRDNLFGLEIDPRCTQIGAFNLALVAWRLVGHRQLPAMNLACSGLAPNTSEADWRAIAGKSEKIKSGMERLYRLFKDAPTLGSLINPRAREGDLLEAAFRDLQPPLEKVLAQETKDDTAHEMAVTARGLTKAAEILASRFTLVATNVPYLGRGKQNDILGPYIDNNYEDGNADLATAFLLRLLSFCRENAGSTAVVTPQNWLFLATYKELRRNLLKNVSWDVSVRLGTNAFQDMNWWAATTALSILSNKEPENGDHFVLLDVSRDKQQPKKAAMLRGDLPCDTTVLVQAGQVKNPDHVITSVDFSESDATIGALCFGSEGSKPGQTARVVVKFWELAFPADTWTLLSSSPNGAVPWSGNSNAIWNTQRPDWDQIPESSVRPLKVWGNAGVILQKVGRLPCALYGGNIFDNNCFTFVPRDREILSALWCFFCSTTFPEVARGINQKSDISLGAVMSIPLNLEHWRKLAAEKYPHGLPKPISSDPTQWLFNGHAKGADQPLHVAVARLLGYQWPRQTGSSFPDCAVLGPDGLEKFADDDGIVCVPAVRGERPAHEGLLLLMEAAWGDDWNDPILASLLSDGGSSNLDDWLRNGFFEQHCKLFHHRPFIWHIWDGRKGDGFHALVNSHKLAEGDGKGRRLLDSLTYSYLGDWITRQQDGVKRGEGGAEDRLAAALELQKRLIAILEGEPPFDLFVRWKPIEGQAIGWEPDINDGVRLNIRPFMAQDIPSGKKGAGILRAKPNIHWKKDRGKERVRDQEQYPWFWDDGKFTGERINDLHLTITEKRAARDLPREKT